MGVKKYDERKILVFCNEQYQISRVRRVKLVREIANGIQKMLIEWK